MSQDVEQGGPPELPYGSPPVVYVPCAEHVADPAKLRVEYKTARDGRKALLVYSALDRLLAGMGKAQPWFVAQTAKLGLLWETDRFDLVLMDLLVPEEYRRQAPGGEGGRP